MFGWFKVKKVRVLITFDGYEEIAKVSYSGQFNLKSMADYVFSSFPEAINVKVLDFL